MPQKEPTHCPSTGVTDTGHMWQPCQNRLL